MNTYFIDDNNYKSRVYKLDENWFEIKQTYNTDIGSNLANSSWTGTKEYLNLSDEDVNKAIIKKRKYLML